MSESVVVDGGAMVVEGKLWLPDHQRSSNPMEELRGEACDARTWSHPPFMSPPFDEQAVA